MLESKSATRKDAIAMAAIEIIGKQGNRTLSHRAVDKHLKLPEGSTSFYFRRRADLLEAGFRKLIEIDHGTMRRFLAPVASRIATEQPVGVRLFAECHYDLWKWITLPENEFLIIARFEFLLQGTRDTSVRESQATILAPSFASGANVFAVLGARQPNWASLQYFNVFRADSMAHFLVPSAVRWLTVTPEYFETRFNQIIEAANQQESDLPDYL